MKVILEKAKLNTALNSVSRAIITTASIPALEGVLFEAKDNKVILTGYNLEIGIKTEFDATVEVEGSTVMSAKLLSQIVKKAPMDDITISFEEKSTVVQIVSGKSNFEIVAVPTKEYPDLPKFETTDEIVVDGEVLKDIINATSYACSNNNLKPIYTGSLYEFAKNKLTVVAVDGFRLAIKCSEIVNNNDNTIPIVIPQKTQLEVARLFADNKVRILIGQKHIAFKSENTTIISRLIEGTFLDYKSTIPTDDKVKTTLTVDIDTILSAVDRMALLGSSSTPSPLHCLIKDEVTLSSSSTIGKAKEIITALECQIEGEDVQIGFNTAFMIDALSHFNGIDKVTFSFAGSLSPATIKAAAGKTQELHMIVPMRISK